MNALTNYTPLGVPPRTRVYHIVRHDGEWRVWIAVKDMQANYSQWRGTYLALGFDGSVTRVTIQPDGSEDIMEVMPHG